MSQDIVQVSQVDYTQYREELAQNIIYKHLHNKFFGSNYVFVHENGHQLSRDELRELCMPVSDAFLKGLENLCVCFKYDPDQKSLCIGELLF